MGFAVGITGHRDLSRFDIKELEKRLYSVLTELKSEHGELELLSSIAAGADQLCAKIALDLGIALVCPLPFAAYESDFTGEELDTYKELLSKAKDSFFVSSGDNKDIAYLKAGRYVADNCSLLLAVWDLKPQASICGTAAIVQYALEKGKQVIVLEG